jgi:hypothetical protein
LQRVRPVGSEHESPLIRRLVPWIALSLWAGAALISTALRPGELLEFGLVGLAGLGAWQVIRRAESRRLQVTATVLFFVPLLNTWPARAFYAQIDNLGVVAYILSPSSLLALLIVAVAPWQRRFPAAMPLAIALLLVAAVLVSTAVSSDRPAAATSAWLALILPLCVAAAVAVSATTTSARWTLLIPPGLASLVPAAMGITAWAISFGIPSSFDDVVAAKTLLYRTGLLQEVTFGNVAHLSAFGLLMAPLAAMATLATTLPTAARACAAASAALLVIATIAVYSRAAILVCAGMLAVSATLVASRLWRERRTEAVTAAILLGATAVAVGSLGWSSLNPEFETADNGSAVRPPPQTSVEFRMDAIRTGLRLSGEHPLGVGSGQYANYDPVHTSPHSLLLQLFVENGVLGGASCLVLLVALCLAIVRFTRVPIETDEWLLRVGCALGTGGFLVFGLIAGAPLALGAVAVWSLLLAVQIGILFSRPEARTT